MFKSRHRPRVPLRAAAAVPRPQALPSPVPVCGCTAKKGFPKRARWVYQPRSEPSAEPVSSMRTAAPARAGGAVLVLVLEVGGWWW